MESSVDATIVRHYNAGVRGTRVSICLALLAAATTAPQLVAQTPGPQTIYERAVADFMAGRFSQSATAFDELARADPGTAPELWQRGIALYYAGRYKDCRQQFELHRTVNPNDVENAVWHFLCVARGESLQAARAAVLPVGPDARTPMHQVYEMFRGTVKPADVLAAAGTRPEGQFYAHLYIGLYGDAIGDRALALEHITAAADDRFAMGGYMHSVAKLHLDVLRRQKP
jgi:lipoprotein NlpI